MSTFTVKCQGVIVALTDTFEDAERIARTVGPEALIECPNGVTLEFVMGWYRQVGVRSDLFKAASTMSHEWTAEEILAREA